MVWQGNRSVRREEAPSNSPKGEDWDGALRTSRFLLYALIALINGAIFMKLGRAPVIPSFCFFEGQCDIPWGSLCGNRAAAGHGSIVVTNDRQLTPRCKRGAEEFLRRWRCVKNSNVIQSQQQGCFIFYSSDDSESSDGWSCYSDSNVIPSFCFSRRWPHLH
jgi:hypothetical protein